ncbi:Putative cysteine proteinase CG12163 [Harpegnathos saltator]|uniref:Putative cysteine proteinase CG12163 n=1 Tax=Harpegnathos saltator TaxID=610380 RepID=E2BV82_HARSA|nr:Putative cysteine proteinase CG12163 [Harpegnathos saltator]
MGFLVYVYLGYLLLARVQSNPVNIPVNQVPLTLWERAWSALNEHSPTHHLYAQGNLINAQELVEPPYKIYKFTYNLSPICGAESPVSGSPCPKEACTIDLKQDENGEIETLNDSIQCMYFYPADAQNEVSQEQQGDQSTSYQEQEDSQVTESLAEQVNNNRSVELYHEVQETGDENVRPFIAMRASNPSYCPGCPYELNPQLMGLLPFSKQALKSMDEQSTGDYKHKLIKIVKVTRSVPVSSNVIQYQLLLLIGESECLKNALEQDECPLQVDVPAKLCLITFEQQPWQQTGLKITKNNCTSPENVSSSNNLSQQPDSESLSQMTVKYDEGQPLKDAYEGLKDILDNYTHAPTSPEISSESKETSSKRAVTEPTIVKILLNRSQDDEKNEGFFDKTKEFGEFLEDFDVPVKVEHVTPESMKEGEFKRKKVRAENFMVEKAIDRNVVNRQKRSPQVQLVGAPSPISVNDSDVQMYVEKALRMVSHDSDEPNEPSIVEIVKATVQVVAGSLHKITVKMGTSHCAKGTKNNCQLQAGSEVKDCQISVLSQSWLDKGEPSITVECPPPPEMVEKATDRNVVNRQKRSPQVQLLGAPSPISVNDSGVQMYVEKALRKVSHESNEPNEPIVVEIVKATVQTVAGRLHKITVRMGTSNCPKGPTHNWQLQAGSEMKDCQISVLSQPWLDSGEPSITVECPPPEKSHRKERSLRGTNYNEKMLRIAEDMRSERLFENFVNTYNRTYATEEERNLRLSIFRENLGIIRLLRKNEQGTGQYGVNQFADVSTEEFHAFYLGLRPDLRTENNIPLRQAEIPDIELPNSFDWRQKGAVTPVKNQGMCGSCWAFSVTGNVEGQYAIKHNKLLSLSEQELVDCDDLDEGCNGGLPDNAYRAIEKLGGLELESDYPYEAENERCHFKKNMAKVQVGSAVNITSNETQIAQWLVANGPISIGINANAMQFYMGGVSHPFKFLCNPKNLDHGVLIVGYGTSNYPLFHKKLPYWIVKNSWGDRWGEQGYYRVYRGDGTCGLNTMASSAVVV